MSDKQYTNPKWLQQKVNEGLTQKEIGRLCNVTQSTIRYHMSKHNIEAANARPDSDEGYLEDLKSVAKELGRAPTTLEYNERGKYSEQPFYDRYGSWTNAIKQIGLEPPKLYNISDKKLTKDINRVAAKIGHAPSQSEYEHHGEYGVNTHIQRQGSWLNAIKQAGLERSSPPGRGATKNEILADIKRVAQETSAPMSTSLYEEHGVYSTSTIYRRLNGWNTALRSVGVEVGENHPAAHADDDEVLEDLKTVLNEYGTSVPATVYDKNGQYSWQTVTRRFNSWPEALRKAGYEPTRGIWDELRNIMWDSYWEKRVADILDEAGIEWERQVEFNYENRYIADFVVDDIIIEVKGRVDYGGESEQINIIERMVNGDTTVLVIGSSEARTKMTHSKFIKYPPTDEKLVSYLEEETSD